MGNKPEVPLFSVTQVEKWGGFKVNKMCRISLYLLLVEGLQYTEKK